MLAVAGVVLLILIGCVLLQFRSGIHVTVENSGSTPIRSVVLHVTGNSYSLSDLLPGASSQATVHATSESHLEIEIVDADGKPQRLTADCYFEPSYRGKIHVSIKDGAIDRYDEQLELWGW